MSPRSARLALLPLLAAVPLLPASGQAPTRAVVLADLLRPGRTVRVHTAAQGRAQGEVVRVQGDTVVLRQDGAERAVPVAEVDTAWHRVRSVKAGAITGAGAGLVGGAYIGFVGAAICEGSDCWSVAPAMIVGGVAGAAAAGVVGAAVGAAIPHWARAWPAR